MTKDYPSVSSIRDETESELRWEQARRRYSFLTAAIALLTVALAGLIWYAYPKLGRHDPLLSQVPTTLADAQRDIFGLRERSKATDAKVNDWTTRQQELQGQFEKTRGDLAARIDAAAKQASAASNALAERVRSSVAGQIDSIKTQRAKLESSGQSDRDQIARLQQELAQVRSQMEQQGQELASVQNRVTQNAESNQQELASVKATQKTDRRDFDESADKFSVKRLDFEVTKNHESTVAPGVSLQVNGTDVSYQRVNGSILVAPDHHTIWLRQLKVQEPVFLTSFPDGRTRELVITRVNKNGALGYVLVPAQETAANRVTNPARAE